MIEFVQSFQNLIRDAAGCAPLIFSEFENAGMQHCEVNAAFLATARAAYPDSDLHFFAERTHCAQIKLRLSTHDIPDIRFHNFFSLPKRGRVRSIILEFLLFTRLFFYVKYFKAQRLVLCALRERRVRWANLIAKLCKDTEVIAIMHHTHDCFQLTKK